MKRSVFSVLILALAAGSAFGQDLAQGGELVGKITAIDYDTTQVIRDLPVSVYTVLVYDDRAYSGTPAEAGTTVTFLTPGSKSVYVDIDGTDLSLSTIGCILGEPVFVQYARMGDELFLIDKWTVWRRGTPREKGTPKEKALLQDEGAKFERFLSSPDSTSRFDSELLLFHTAWDRTCAEQPQPKEGRSWLDYGLLSIPQGSLGEVREKLRLKRERAGERVR